MMAFTRAISLSIATLSSTHDGCFSNWTPRANSITALIMPLLASGFDRMSLSAAGCGLVRSAHTLAWEG
jgi:hypothetical protein